MTRHLLKLVWNRKRSNALIILEIFFSFLVLDMRHKELGLRNVPKRVESAR